ncbi:hypothetical protein FQN50_006927 [Emmonsiellopsis sp. PD_5]|nr:hypothetical protein FQN50_006927 [Emmonsiellopsis sp. PD_5]
MNTAQLTDDLRELYRNRSSFIIPDVPYFDNPRSGILWKFGPIFTERETCGDDPICDAYISEVGATCVATQIRGPNPGLQGIAKIRMQIPDDPSSTQPQSTSARSGFELYNHEKLTELGCTCTPKLLDSAVFKQNDHCPVPNGFIHYLIMEKVPGRNLVNFGDLPMPERNQVRLAFAKSIREFYALRFNHLDPGRRNLIWDAANKKCYIIDLEDAYEINDADDPEKFCPEFHFRKWGIAGPESNTSEYGWDPMVPHDRSFQEDPGDEALEKMAAEAEGKPVQIVKYDYSAIAAQIRARNAANSAES